LGDWPNINFIEGSNLAGVVGRFWFEKRRLPGLIRHSGANVLLSTGNFALLSSPVPQILLSRNALYTSSDFLTDLRRRGEYKIWLDTLLKAQFAKLSIKQADVTVAPSNAFATDIFQWTGKKVLVIHHGFDATAFTKGMGPLPPEAQAKLEATSGSLRLLFVSHYNYYRNFETLIRALTVLRDRLAPRKLRLILTCELRSEANPGSYRADSAADLVRDLGIAENVIELGSVPYTLLHHVYRACDIYVTPAYAETFAHPLVEAMSSGLPVVASDLPVHREICGQAARYFPRFSAESLATEVIKLAEDDALRATMSRAGLARSKDFSWSRHVDELLTLAGAIARPTSLPKLSGPGIFDPVGE
jgi:glycosyltransferase involved in cell wall biosynthesis